MDKKNLRSVKEHFKEFLLDLLKNDSDVQEEIITIINKSDNPNKKMILSETAINLHKSLDIKKDYEKELADKQLEINALQSRCLELERQNTMLSIKIDSLNSEYSKVNNELDKQQSLCSTLKKQNSSLICENEIAKNKLFNYKESYSELERIYKKFNSLDEKVLNSYCSILNNSTPLAFLVTGAESDNIYLFFEKVCMEWRRYDSKTLIMLNEVFDFLFEHFCINNPEYKRIVTQIGDEFDSETHSRTSDSLPVGRVKKVIISGYINQTGTKKFKSLAEIG